MYVCVCVCVSLRVCPCVCVCVLKKNVNEFNIMTINFYEKQSIQKMILFMVELFANVNRFSFLRFFHVEQSPSMLKCDVFCELY